MESKALAELYNQMAGSDARTKKERLIELADNLSRIAGREKPWTWRYLFSLLNGDKGFTMTHELQTAIEALGMKLDGANPLQARLVEITAYSINGNVAPGSIITGHSTRCPGCLVLFVPHHNLQVYCGKECPGRPRKRAKAADAL